MEKASWYNSQHSTKLDLGMFKVSVYQDVAIPRGEPIEYRFSYAGLQSRQGYNTREEAKAAAEASARRNLSRALVLLDGVEALHAAGDELAAALLTAEATIASLDEDDLGRHEELGHPYRDELLSVLGTALRRWREATGN